MDVDLPTAARAVALLLHPHPGFGGNRFHPFVDGLFSRLPPMGVGTVRFDFSGSDPAGARDQALAALDTVCSRIPEVPVALVGYSFGAGVASGISDRRVSGWYLLAPQVAPLEGSPIGPDPRPKAVVVPELDQFSPPAAMETAVAGWEATTLFVLPDTDHFLGAVGSVVDGAVDWIVNLVGWL